MSDDLFGAEFARERARLHAVAYRMLGSSSEADDAVQEAWLRLRRTGTAGIDNLAAWLTTVVGRICLDMLRSRGIRREEPLSEAGVGPIAADAGPEQRAVLADAVGAALIVVLETLSPAERLAFVLHDMFAVSFDEIAVIIGRSPAAARQLASRARRRVRDGSPTRTADAARRRAIVDAFLTAARGGDLTTLLTLLAPDVVLRVDEAAARIGGIEGETRGAEAAARFFAGRARSARPAEIDGALGIAVLDRGVVRIAVFLTVDGGRISAIEGVADPAELARLEVVLSPGESVVPRRYSGADPDDTWGPSDA